MNRLLRRLLIVLGLSIALTAFGLGFALPAEDTAALQAQPSRVSVMVVARPIVSGNRIEKADIAWREVNFAAVPAGALTRPAHSELELVGAVALRSMAAGEPIAAKDFAAAPANASLAGSLNPGWRAVTIAADNSQTAAGMLQPNDRVDLVFTTVVTRPGAAPVSAEAGKPNGAVEIEVINTIANVRVIAINGAMKPEPPKADDAEKTTNTNSGANNGSVTLEVQPDQVAAVLKAAAGGKLALSLRSRFDAAGPSAVLTRIPDLTPPAPKGGAGAKPAPRAKPKAAPLPGVIIIRGLEKPRAN